MYATGAVITNLLGGTIALASHCLNITSGALNFHASRMLITPDNQPNYETRGSKFRASAHRPERRPIERITTSYTTRF